MTPNPRMLDADATVREAARLMANEDIGDVIVCEGGNVTGIVTDRDITVRAVGAGMPCDTTPLSEICTKEVVTLSPDSTAEEAMQLMREQAIRRIPVVDDGKPIGIVSLGDLAMDRDQDSLLADISEAPSNN